MRIPTAALALLGTSTLAQQACEPNPTSASGGASSLQVQPSSPQVQPSAPSPPPPPQPLPLPSHSRPQVGPLPSAASVSPERAWTAGIVQIERQHAVQTQVGIRVGEHAGYERVVFEFDESVPGYHLEYIDKPVRDCGAGHVRPVAGEGWLEVRFNPARAHDAAGRPTMKQRELRPRQPLVLELERTCDFEAMVTWVIGVASPNRYRVLELDDPPRLVVDVRTQ